MPDRDTIEDRLRTDARVTEPAPPSLDEVLRRAVAGTPSRRPLLAGLTAAAAVLGVAMAAPFVLGNRDRDSADRQVSRDAVPFTYVELYPSGDALRVNSVRPSASCVGIAPRVQSQDADQVVIELRRRNCRAGIRFDVTLDGPLAGRAVVDASTGRRVPVVDPRRAVPHHLPARFRDVRHGPAIGVTGRGGVAVQQIWTTQGGHDSLTVLRATGGARVYGEPDLPGTARAAEPAGSVDGHPAILVERTQYNGQVVARCLDWRSGGARFSVCASWYQVGERMPVVNPPARPVPADHLPARAAELRRVAESLP